MSKFNFYIINGPNLNLLGSREPEIYGTLSLDDIKIHTEKYFVGKNVNIEWHQSNLEGEIVQKIQDLSFKKEINALIINPAGYTHSSVAIYDALKLLNIPIIEVHISNTYKREDFRMNKVTTRASTSVIEGFGKETYILAIQSQLLK